MYDQASQEGFDGDRQTSKEYFKNSGEKYYEEANLVTSRVKNENAINEIREVTSAQLAESLNYCIFLYNVTGEKKKALRLLKREI